MKPMRILMPLLLLPTLLAVTAATVAAKPPAAAKKGTAADVANNGKPDAAAAAAAWRVRHGEYYQRNFGLDIIGVHLTESNWMLKFTYRVTDAALAKPLMAKEAKPYLVDRPSGAKLAVPAMENIGELRQAVDPDVGRQYYILFGNANQIVRRGNVVDIEIGNFRVEGLPVE